MAGHSSAPLSAQSRVFVAGHRGLVGSALVRRLRSAGVCDLICRTHAEVDLTDGAATRRFFEEQRPELVVLAAARVGGILANNTYPAEFIRDNLAIQTNVIHEAWRCGVSRLLFLGSSCIYPRDCPQPMRETHLLTGPLEATNRPYAVAKISGIEMCWAYNRQYGTRFLAVMPTNLFGPGDNYDLETSHVLPALIRKFHEAKLRGEEGSAAAVTVWGTGTPRREFLYSDDLADACLHLLSLPGEDFDRVIAAEDLPAGERGSEHPPLVNIGAGADIAIRDLVHLVQEIVGFEGPVVWDSSKPDGTPRKLLDVRRMQDLAWQPRTGLREGIARAYAAFLEEHADSG